MADSHNVFISWSGPRSKAAAEAFNEWLPMILQAAHPWMSATDIDKGTRWREEVSLALDIMKAGIICVTPENRTAEWLLFESGALSKTRDPKNRVWTYLLAGLKPEDLRDPLAMFNHTIADKDDTRKLLHSINANLDGAVAEGALNRLFDKLWPDLEDKLSALPKPDKIVETGRPTHEMIAEILEFSRASVSEHTLVDLADLLLDRFEKLPQKVVNALAPPISGDNLSAWRATGNLRTLADLLGAPTKPASPPATGKGASLNPEDFAEALREGIGGVAATNSPATAAQPHKRRHVSPSRNPNKS
jgi:hypothetical protein